MEEHPLIVTQLAANGTAALGVGGPLSPTRTTGIAAGCVPPPQRVILNTLNLDHAGLAEGLLGLAAILVCCTAAQQVLELAAHVAAL